MGFIYKITNKVNGKSYIGKTLQTVELRWKRHLKDAFRERTEHRPLYDAIQKYGILNFEVSTIEECSEQEINTREIYWINKFDTYKNGYNATYGGDGMQIVDYDHICEVFLKNHNTSETARICNCCQQTVTSVLKSRNIQYYQGKRKVLQYTLDGIFLQEFESLYSAAQDMIDKGFAKGIKSGVAQTIRRVAQGKGKKAYGYYWEYA